MKDSIFIDSNVWVYLFSADDENKRNIAERFIKTNGSISILVISYQVINEVTNVLIKKKFSESNIRDLITLLTKICVIQDYSKDIVLLASRLREKHFFSFWDSHIVASAITAKCTFLVSEDMHDGFVIDGMTINNIF
jgi:predicted nucleic acid-binding protein